MLAYISLQLKLRFGFDKETKLLKRITSLLITLLTSAVMLFLLKYFFENAERQLSKYINIEDFSIIIFLIIEVVLIVLGIVIEIKVLLNPPDIKIVARFPLSPIKIFVSELIIVYGYLFVMSTILFLSIMLIFGWAMSILSATYILRMFLMLLFAPMIPFALSTILSVPIMLIITALNNHNIIKLCLFVIVLVGLFVAYNYFLNLLADFYISQKLDNSTIESWVKILNILNSDYDFLSFVKNIMFGKIGLDMVYVLAIFIGGTSIGVGIAIPLYGRIRKDHLEGTGKFFSKKTQVTNDSKFLAILKKEALEIIRTQTYAYFYLGVAISTPVMVFFINRLMNSVGEAQLGSSINFGVSILVLCIYMAMVNSFAATSVSREGKRFYITKIMPYDYKKQLLAKIVLNLAVSIGALLISTIIIASLKFVVAEQVAVVFFACLVYAIGIIANGYNVNLSKPSLKENLDGEVGESNITLMLFIGIIVATIMGAVTIVCSFLLSPLYTYLLDFGIAFIYAVVNIVIFLVTANKKYEKIEFR